MSVNTRVSFATTTSRSSDSAVLRRNSQWPATGSASVRVLIRFGPMPTRPRWPPVPNGMSQRNESTISPAGASSANRASSAWLTNGWAPSSQLRSVSAAAPPLGWPAISARRRESPRSVIALPLPGNHPMRASPGGGQDPRFGPPGTDPVAPGAGSIPGGVAPPPLRWPGARIAASRNRMTGIRADDLAGQVQAEHAPAVLANQLTLAERWGEPCLGYLVIGRPPAALVTALAAVQDQVQSVEPDLHRQPPTALHSTVGFLVPVFRPADHDKDE